MRQTPTARSTGRASTMVFSVGCGIAVLTLVAYFLNAKQAECRFGRFGDLVGVGLLSFALACACGYAASRRFGVVWVLGILATGLALSPVVGHRVELVIAARDDFRLVALVLVLSLISVGLYVGQRCSGCRPSSSRPWRFLMLAPFALIVSVSGAWLQTLSVIWCITLARATGGLACRALLGADEARVPAALGTIVGFTMHAFAVLVIGLLGGCSPVGLLVYWVLLTVVLARPTWRAASELARSLAVEAPTSAATAAMRGALIALFAVYFVAALGPETGWDATALRVAAPAHWLKTGSIVPMPQLAATYGVCAGETLSLLLMPLAHDSATRLLAFASALVLLRSLGEDVLARRDAPGSVLWFPLIASSLVWWQMAAGLVDFLQALHFYGAILAVQLWRYSAGGSRRVGWLALAGLCAGGAAAIKWNGGIALIVLLLVALFAARQQWRSQAKSRVVSCVRTSLPIVVAFGCIVGPWVARSWWLTGNPVFPFANEWFESPLAPSTLVRNKYGIGVELTSWLRMPVSVFFEPLRYGEEGTFHPSLLGLFPLGICGLWFADAERRRRAGLWLGAGVIAFILWGVSEQNARYGMFIAVFLTVAIVIGLDSWLGNLGRRGRTVLLSLAVVFGLGGFVFQRCPAGDYDWNQNCDALFPIEVVLGQRTVEEHLTNRVMTYGPGSWLAKHADGPTKTWVRDPLRADNLYLPGEASRYNQGITPRMAPLSRLAETTTPEARERAHRRLAELGYTHILDGVFPGETSRIPPAPHGVTSRDSWQRFLDPCFVRAGTRLFELRATPRSSEEISNLYGPDLFSLGELADGAALTTRTVPVEPGSLYELEVSLLTGPLEASLDVGVRFLDAVGEPVEHWSQKLVGGSDATGVEGFLHAAPPWAVRVEVSTSGDLGRFRLDWRRVLVRGSK